MARWRGWLWIGFVVVLLLLVSGVLDDAFRQEPGRIQLESASASHSYQETYTLEADVPPQLVIQGGAGDVTIQASREARAITVAYTKTAYSTSEDGAGDELADVQVTVDHAGSTLRITTTQRRDESSVRPNRVDLVITVPEAAALDIYLGTGTITITGVHAVGKLSARTLTGSAMIADVIAPEGMDIQANAGSLAFAGSIGPDGDYTLIAAVGALTVRLPAETNARLDAQSVFGAITVEGFDLVDASRQQLGSGESLRGIMGQGGPTLTLKNQLGDIQIAAE